MEGNDISQDRDAEPAKKRPKGSQASVPAALAGGDAVDTVRTHEDRRQITGGSQRGHGGRADGSQIKQDIGPTVSSQEVKLKLHHTESEQTSHKIKRCSMLSEESVGFKKSITQVDASGSTTKTDSHSRDEKRDGKFSVVGPLCAIEYTLGRNGVNSPPYGTRWCAAEC